MKLAIVGGGIAGLTAARILHTEHDVVLFENQTHVGGDARTLEVQDGPQKRNVDLGVSVFHRSSYPLFFQLMDRLSVELSTCDLSLELAASRLDKNFLVDFNAPIIRQPSLFLTRRFWKLNAEIVRLKSVISACDESTTLGEALEGNSFSASFKTVLLGVCMGVWTMRCDDILSFQATFVLKELDQMFSRKKGTSNEWCYVPGSVQTYLTKLAEPLNGSIRCNSRVSRIARHDGSVVVDFNENQSEHFDEVIFAIPAEEALALIDSPHHEEQQILAQFRSATHDITLSKGLHQEDRQRRSSSLYIDLNTEDDNPREWYPEVVSCNNQRISKGETTFPYYISLVRKGTSEPANTLFRWTSTTPRLYPEVLQSQKQHSTVSGRDRIHYCGSCWGNGLHEAAIQSALAVTRHFDLGMEAI